MCGMKAYLTLFVVMVLSSIFGAENIIMAEPDNPALPTQSEGRNRLGDVTSPSRGS